MKFLKVFTLTLAALISTNYAHAMNTPGAGSADGSLANSGTLCTLSAEQITQAISTKAVLDEFRDYGTVKGIPVNNITFSPQTAREVKALNADVVYRFDYAGKPQELEGQASATSSIAFSPDDTMLVTKANALGSYTTHIWKHNNQHGWNKKIAGNANDSELITTPSRNETTTHAWSQDACENWVSTEIALPVFPDKTNMLAFDKTQNLMLSKTFVDREYVSFIHTFNNGSWSSQQITGPKTTLSGYENAITRATFSPDSSTLATAHNDRSVHIWNKKNTGWEQTSQLFGWTDQISALSFNHDGTVLATGGDFKDKKIHVHALVKGEWKSQATIKGHKGAIWSVALSPDGKTLASASSDQTARLWRRLGAEWQPFKTSQHNAAVHAVSFNHEGSALASASADKKVRVWQAVDLVGSHNALAKILFLRLLKRDNALPKHAHLGDVLSTFDKQAQDLLQSYFERTCVVCLSSAQEIKESQDIQGNFLGTLNCCHQPLCNDCYVKCIGQQKETCPHCRQRENFSLSPA